MRSLKQEPVDRSFATAREEMKMGMEPPSCRGEALFSNRDCTVWQCRCGIYHVQIHTATLHLTAAQEEFAALADLFERAQEREEEAALFSKWEG